MKVLVSFQKKNLQTFSKINKPTLTFIPVFRVASLKKLPLLPKAAHMAQNWKPMLEIELKNSVISILWAAPPLQCQYGLWSFKGRDTKLERFLAKTQLKWNYQREGVKKCKNLTFNVTMSMFYVKYQRNLSDFFFIEKYELRRTFFVIDIFWTLILKVTLLFSKMIPYLWQLAIAPFLKRTWGKKWH